MTPFTQPVLGRALAGGGGIATPLLLLGGLVAGIFFVSHKYGSKKKSYR